VSETPHPTDVEVSRSLNALVATLNDRRVGEAEGEPLQRIVTGALGGEQRILIRLGPARTTAELTDGEGNLLARVELREGRWVGERVGSPLTGGYVPSVGGAA
jgi:hypothetical protein